MGTDLVDVVVTGASRGLGQALTSAVQAARPGVHRFILSAQPGRPLEEAAGALRAQGAEVIVVPGDLSSVRSASELGRRLADVVGPGAVGGDFGPVATYCNTKLAGAVVLRDLAAEHPSVDVLVCHPGVVDTGLGAEGWLRWPLQLAKRLLFERPAAAGARLARILAAPRWSTVPGEAPWWNEERPEPWPEVATDPALREAVRRAVALGLSQLSPGSRPRPA